MSETSRAPQEAQVISLVERRNNEVARLLEDLYVDAVTVKKGIEKEYEELGEVVRLPFLEDVNIDDKVVDFSTFKKNKEKRSQNEVVTDRIDVLNKIHDLIGRVKQAMTFLYKTKFTPIMTASHVMGESEINPDFKADDFHKFSEGDFIDKPAFISLKFFFPDIIQYLEETISSIELSASFVKERAPNSEQLKGLLGQLRNDLQSGVQHAEYFSQNFDKHNPLK